LINSDLFNHSLIQSLYLMFKKYITLIVILSVVSIFCSPTHGFHTPAHLLDARPITEVLAEIEVRYNVFFSYNKNSILNIEVDFSLEEEEPLSSAIERLLSPVGLSYESFGDRYFVIYKESKKGRDDLLSLEKHFKAIEQIESRGLVKINRNQEDKRTTLDQVEKDSKQFSSPVIQGKVIDSTGEPLVGATIQINETPRGTFSDNAGNFSIDIPIPSTIQISYVGYDSKEIVIDSIQQVLQVALSKSDYFLEDIIVTARKRKESLHETPMSITAIPAKQLEQNAQYGLDALNNIAPNLIFSNTGAISGSNSTAVVYIRGIGQNDYVPVVDPGVGIYVDEVYLGRTIGAVLDLTDFKQIEIIRGPQGTLFGRNTIGGAISLTSKNPTENFQGKLQLTGGSYRRNDARLTLSGPIKKNIGFTFNAIRKNRKGYVKRVNVPDSALGDENSHGAKLKLTMTNANQQLSLKIIADYFREREASAPEQNLFFHADRLIPELWNSGEGVSTATGWIPGNATVGSDIYDERQNLAPFRTGETSLSRNDIDTYGVSANLGYIFDEKTSARLITAYRNLNALIARQVDGSPLNIFEYRDDFSQYQFSADLKVNRTGRKFESVAGLFYFNEHVENQVAFGGVLNGIKWPGFVGGLVHNFNYATYGEISYFLSKKWVLTGGIRYTGETKKAQPDAFLDPTASLDSTPISPPLERNPIKDEELPDIIDNPLRLIDKIWQENSFDKITWRANIKYRPSSSVHLFANASTGFKSGGFDWRVTDDTQYNQLANDWDGDGDGDLPQISPETVTSFEIGSKFKWTDNRLRLHLTGFYTIYQNLQISTNPPETIATFLANAGNGRIKGLEAELFWKPSPDFVLQLGYGHTDAAYTHLKENVIVSLEDEFVFAPKNMLNGSASYQFSFSNGSSLTSTINGHYTSSIHFEAQNSEYVMDPGHYALNAAIRYQSNHKWSATFGAENLTNQHYLISGDANTVIGYENGIYARPRNFFVNWSYLF